MMKNDLMKRILKNSDNPYIATLEESPLLDKTDPTVTEIPALNVILSGSVDGGFDSGITTIAGESKHFKTLFGLYMSKAFLNKYEDGVLVFFDSEFGSPRSYFNFFEGAKERVIHVPVMTVEDLRTQMLQMLEDFDRDDKVMFMVDSIGNLASIKETEDSIDGKTTVDMTRAKMVKSLFRLVTPRFAIKDIPCVVIGHTYQTLEMFSKQVLGGGCLLPNTKLLLSDGSLKDIEDIEVGDELLTHEGNYKVTNTWNPETLTVGEPECYEIEFEDGSIVRCSENHPFMIGGDWVETNSIKIGDDLKTL